MNSVTHAVGMSLARRVCAANTMIVSGIALFLAAASPCAYAADVPTRGPYGPPPVAPPPYLVPYPYYNWTGFYVGGNVGVGWEDGATGFVGGGQIGYNWQISPQFVIGVEWMFDGASVNSDNGVIVGLGSPVAIDSKVDWVTSLAARFGWAFNNWLFYGKAGAGWVHESATLTSLTSPFAVSVSDTSSGLLLGVGAEYGFAPRWTARVEWDHIGLGDETIAGFTPGDVVLSRHFDMLTFGLNYRF